MYVYLKHKQAEVDKFVLKKIVTTVVAVDHVEATAG